MFMYCGMSYYRNYIIKVYIKEQLGVAFATLLCYNKIKQKESNKMFCIAIYFMLVAVFMGAVIWILSPCIYTVAYLSVVIIKLIVGAFKKLRKVFR